MKVWLPTTVFIVILWVLQAFALPIFVPVYLVPRLVLAGLVVLAVNEEKPAVLWLIFLVGMWMDIVSGLLVGSYTLGLVLIYLANFAFQKEYLPNSYRYLAVIGLSMLASLALDLWIVSFTWLSGKFGWPLEVGNYFNIQLGTWLRLFLTGGVAFFLYIFWQELSHRLSKPLNITRARS